MIDPESELCGWPVGFCKCGRSMIGTSISPWQWSHTLVTWFCSTVVMNELSLSTYYMFRAFITCVICQIYKCLCLNNDLLWGTSWRLQSEVAVETAVMRPLKRLKSSLLHTFCGRLDNIGLLEGFWRIFEGCKQQSYKIFEAVYCTLLRTLGQYWFVGRF